MSSESLERVAGEGNKRARSSVACDGCRERPKPYHATVSSQYKLPRNMTDQVEIGARKLACDGHQPCGRCLIDGRSCVMASKSEKTPLTRARMTQLEEKVQRFEDLWLKLFPQAPLWVEVDETLYKDGSQAALQQVLPRISKDLPYQPDSLLQPRMQRSVSTSLPATSSITERTSTIPMTRASSPDGMTLMPASDYYPNDQRADNARYWHESLPVPMKSHANEAPLDGMGGKGAPPHGSSFLGLSSSATFLHAIERFSGLNANPHPSIPYDVKSSGTTLGTSRDTLSNFQHPFAELLRQHTGEQVGRRSAGVIPDTESAFQMPAWSKVRHMVDGYFRHFHLLTPLVHEPTIRAQMTGAIPLRSSTSISVLFNMIFALGGFDSALKEGGDDGAEYYHRARAALRRDWPEEGNLELVQGLGIMAIYLQQSNKPNAGYLCLGSAIRMAVALGLHRPHRTKESVQLVEPGRPQSDGIALESEIQIRTWWSLVTLETGCSITFGRPYTLGSALHSLVPVPVNCEDENLTVSSRLRPVDVEHPTAYSSLIIQVHLAKAACQIYDRILHSDRAPTIAQIQWGDEELIRALNDIPAVVRTPAKGCYQLAMSIQLWRSRDQRTILYRPVLLAAASAGRRSHLLDAAAGRCVALSRQLSLENLRDIATIVQKFHGPRERGIEWYTLYFGYQAALTILLSLVWEPDHLEATSWRETLEATTTWFRTLNSVSTLAHRYAVRIENLVRQVTFSPPLGNVAYEDRAQTLVEDPLDWSALYDTAQGAFINSAQLPMSQLGEPSFIDFGFASYDASLALSDAPFYAQPPP